MADRSRQTEKPTPRRLEKARQKGRFLSAREMVSAVQFLAFVAVLAWWGGDWIDKQGGTKATINSPASSASSVTSAGMLTTSQCQNPLPVGAKTSSGEEECTSMEWTSG